MLNIFKKYLSLSGVRFTDWYVKETFLSHPHHTSMLGIARLLDMYNVDNTSVRITDKLSLFRLQTPFFAEMLSDIVLVTEISGNAVCVQRENSVSTMGVEDFMSGWSGVVLVTCPTEKSTEPEYREHRVRELVQWTEKGILCFASVYLLLYVFVGARQGTNFLWLATFLIQICGLYVCYLLLMKTWKGGGYSSVADKLCSVIEKGGCNNVLQSRYSKICATYSFSEVGFAFFGVNTIAMTALAASTIVILPYIYLAVLPLSVWSVWYQFYRIKSWCILCLITMSLLWLQTVFFVYIGAFVPVAKLSLCGIIAILLLYAIAVIMVHGMTLYNDYAYDNINLRYYLNSVKLDEEIFLDLLHKQPHFDMSLPDGGMEFGKSRDGMPVITVLSNPYCTHCSEMHRRLEVALTAGMQVRYILTCFNDELVMANRSILATYVKYGSEYTWGMLSRWFSGGFNDGAAFFKEILNNNDVCKRDVDDMFFCNESWVANSGLSATPILMVNGYLLPALYEIEDVVELYRRY